MNVHEISRRSRIWTPECRFFRMLISQNNLVPPTRGQARAPRALGPWAHGPLGLCAHGPIGPWTHGPMDPWAHIRPFIFQHLGPGPFIWPRPWALYMWVLGPHYLPLKGPMAAYISLFLEDAAFLPSVSSQRVSRLWPLVHQKWSMPTRWSPSSQED